MLVTNSAQPGQQPRPALHGVERAETRPAQLAAAGGPAVEPPAHFTMISTISHGSLAAAYQTLRAAPAESAILSGLGEPAILSGLGVPAALAAYNEAAETD